MLHDLFINTLLLISFTFVGGHIIRELPEGFIHKLYGKVFIGVGGGLLGILMMIYSIEVADTSTLLDLRALSIIMISSIGGSIPSIISGIIIFLFRIGYYGVNQSSIFAFFHICLYVLTFHIINKRIITDWKNWLAKIVASVLILVSTLFYLLRNVKDHNIIILTFTLVIIFAGTLEYFLLRYVRRSNELYKLYKKDSTKDFLTGLNNTRSFDKLLNMSFEKALENSEKLSCLMIDIDHFKKVNDTYGHAVGDIVLRELADILKKNCRAFDIIGRVGGEEFCVLLLDCPTNRAFEIGLAIRDAVKKHKFHIGDNRFIYITVSVGVATYPDTVDNLDDIMQRADNALYKAKQSGRDRVCDNQSCATG
jgi:diguanylate cyclase